MISGLNRNYYDYACIAPFIIEIIPVFPLFFPEKFSQLILKMRTTCL